MKKKSINCLLLFLCAAALQSFAQTAGFKFKAGIEAVRETGFYNIILSPQLNARLKPDYSDLRIVNSSGKWIPHLLRLPSGEQTNHPVLWDLVLVKNENSPAQSEWIVRTDKWEITNLAFTLRNTEVQRFGNLTGSDDSSHWFIINDSILISPRKSEDNSRSEFKTHFPANSYRYYRLQVANKGKAPYSILRVASNSYSTATADSNRSLLQFMQNPAASLTQKDSGKLSYFKIVQQAPFHTSQLEFKITGAAFFNRSVDLLVPQAGKDEPGRPGRFLQNFTLSNNSSLAYKVPLFNDSLFYLIIHNEDNLPLKVEQVKTFCETYVATAYLEKGKSYDVIMGNEKATFPHYDLQRADIGLEKSLPVTATGAVTIIPQNKTESGTRTTNRLLVWPAILAAAVALAFFTFKLVKDINRTNNPS
jgi:hypothetical protein